MKYQQPFGTAEDAPYVNGNPATGTQGSIPPAESIEHPQRELVDLITKEGLSPSSLDLGQVAKGIQLAKISYGADTGTQNTLEVSLDPILNGYQTGFPVKVEKIAQANTSSTPTLNVNGRGAKTIVACDGSALEPGNLPASLLAEYIYDGTNFRLLGPAPGSLSDTEGGDNKHKYVTIFNLNARRLPFVHAVSGPFQLIADVTDTKIDNLTMIGPSYLRSGTSFANGTLTIGAADAGMWFFICYAAIEVTTTPTYNDMILSIKRNLATGPFMSSHIPYVTTVGCVVSTPFELFAGDTVELHVWHNTGASRYIGATMFFGMRLGASQ